MKILFLNSAKEWGGNEKWTVNAACGLADIGNTVYLGCRSPIFSQKSWSSNLNFVSFPFTNTFDAATIGQVNKFLRDQQIDILVPTKQREYFLGGLAAWPLRQVKVAARLGIDRPLHNGRNRFAFRRLFDMVIVNSKRIVQALSHTKGFDTNVCRVVYNGVEIPSLSEDIRKKYREDLNVKPNEFLIGCVGRLASQKGFDMALCAFAALREPLPNARLVIVGAGSQEQEYRKLAETLEIDKCVTFAGHRHDVSGFYQAMDLFWLTSRSEGMPNALLEAMAHQKASIAFDVAGVPELVTDGKDGFIVQLGDTNDLVQRTVELAINTETRLRVEQQALQTVKNCFSMNQMISHLNRELQDLITKQDPSEK